jgi:hypothetical protein
LTDPNICSYPGDVDPRHELDPQIRSLAALPFDQAARTREDALKVLTELRDVRARLADVMGKLRAIVEDTSQV